MGGSLRRAAERRALEFVAEDRVADVAPDKADESALLSFPEGRELVKLNVAGSARAVSDPRYLIHLAPEGQDAEVLDLQTLNAVSKISKDGGDVFGGETVSYAADSGLAISRLGEARAEILARVPAGPLPILRTALASPNLETLVVGVAGQGAVYRVSNGAQIANFPACAGRGSMASSSATCACSRASRSHQISKAWIPARAQAKLSGTSRNLTSAMSACFRVR